MSAPAKRVRSATLEEQAYCSACNVFKIGELVRLKVERKGYWPMNIWLCPTCLRHIDKARKKSPAKRVRK